LDGLNGFCCFEAEIANRLLGIWYIAEIVEGLIELGVGLEPSFQSLMHSRLEEEMLYASHIATQQLEGWWSEVVFLR